MIDLLNSIGNLIGSIVLFIVHIFQAIISFIGMIPTYINFLSTSIRILPPFLLPFATFSIFFSVILMIINRKFGDRS